MRRDERYDADDAAPVPMPQIPWMQAPPPQPPPPIYKLVPPPPEPKKAPPPPPDPYAPLMAAMQQQLAASARSASSPSQSDGERRKPRSHSLEPPSTRLKRTHDTDGFLNETPDSHMLSHRPPMPDNVPAGLDTFCLAPPPPRSVFRPDSDHPRVMSLWCCNLCTSIADLAGRTITTRRPMR